ncbi:Inclusion body clearance protein iml2 [Penicillium longicatenatum]|uniref:Inclusion body clearance protein iml2 n=1 Tax=Penicillium longicatenatum TaxID=1561947 RepID=UPI0025483728|nr:Inclusion body clearance protein iml2 [Penicillium longicatenatum]KAJ5630835.1 Inclusion body clearance protein iml2 [Penicillium longicatenatum]
MMRVGSWLYGKKPANASQLIDSSAELRDSATFILNDDVDTAENGLAKGDSTFHQLGKGMVAFVRATLGFEQDIMRQASERLSEAETSAASEQYRAQQNADAPNAFHSEIYTPGTEYVLCQAIAQLLSAVVGVLNESLTESVKAFYRLRKAYIALDTILKMEEKFMEAHRLKQGISTRPSDLSKSSASSDEKLAEKSSMDSSIKGPSTVNGLPTLDTDLARKVSGLSIAQENSSEPVSRTSTPGGSNITHDPDSDIFKNEIDIFIHSGANFCFGILLILISMIPPSFSKLLSIIGFHGDKQRGLRMVWQASKFHNLIGAFAALAVLGYYNGFVRYCDIMPDPTPGEDDVEGYPAERLVTLLAEMRNRFPDSRLWLLEESRMEGANKNLDGAMELLANSKKSPLKQVEALCVFEKSLNALFLHDYSACTSAFIECSDLNSWSRSLYYYIAGSCQVLLYRQCRKTDPKKAEEHAQNAIKYIREAPSYAGKKKFMARQLPFDVFVSRKVAKWEARAKEWGVSLVDAIGVDPVEEMIFFWNGHSRMTDSQLEESLERLAWCESEENPTWSREGAEGQAILDLLRAAVYRSLCKTEEAKEMLKTKVLNHDKALFKSHLNDNWVLPAAHYEMAANLWKERPTYRALHGSSGIAQTSQNADKPDRSFTESGSPGTSEVTKAEKKLVHDCKHHLETAAKWESYEMEARVGLKVTAGKEAVQKWEAMHAS